MEMLFTGTPISAHDALLHGLVSKVVPEERLEDETLAIAKRVCQASRSVVALGKATFQRWQFRQTIFHFLSWLLVFFPVQGPLKGWVSCEVKPNVDPINIYLAFYHQQNIIFIV